MSASRSVPTSRLGACCCGLSITRHFDRATNRFVGCQAARHNQVLGLHDRLSAALQVRSGARVVSAFPSSAARS